MGLFSRRSKDVRPAPDVSPQSDPVVDQAVELPDDGRPVSAPLTDADRTRIAAGIEALAGQGVDVDDLDLIGAAYDRAFADVHAREGEGAAEVVELFGIAIGEYLARHSARSWAVVTDVFGTDLGLIDARADSAIVPHNLVSARWMRGETGWVPGVVGHLVNLRPRR